MKTHDINTRLEAFKASLKGLKTFEIRKNDRDYRKGDRVNLWEYDDGGKDCDRHNYNLPDEPCKCTAPCRTGRYLSGRITHMSTFAQQEGYVVFSLKLYPGVRYRRKRVKKA